MPEQPNSKSKGVVLKEERQRRKLALQAVHESTKIPLDVLKAIEEGYTVRTVSPFYFRGFIKMYAQFLGMDLKNILEDYHEEKLPKHVSGYIEPTSAKAENRIEKIDQFFSRRRQRDILKIAGYVLVFIVVMRMIGCVHQSLRNRAQKHRIQAARQLPRPVPVNRQKESTKTLTPLSQPESEKKSETRKETPKPAIPPKTEAKSARTEKRSTESPQPQTQPQEKNKVVLRIKALKSGWLQVKVDGHTVFQSTIKQGITESWRAEKTIELSGKNIYNMQYEVNGKTIGTLNRQDRNARRVIITADGISVKE